MAYSISTDFCISSFNEAERKYNRVTPIRGNTNDIRPLGNRSAQHMRIVKYNNDMYACRLYDTDVATYHRDGRIIYSTGGWDTISTSNFMCACTPWGWDASKVHNRVQAHHRSTGMWYVVQDGFTINTNTNEVTGYITPTKEVVDRQMTNEKRKLYKPFLQFAQGFMEVLNMEVPYMSPYDGENRALAGTFLRYPTTITEDQYIELLSRMVSVNSWRKQRLTFSQMKSRLYRDTAIKITIDLPIGSLQE